MTAENKDIHSYNCDVHITHKEETYIVNALSGLEIAWERKGVAGKCTFSIAQEDDGKIEFEEGDAVRVRISKTWMFFGFIFTKNRSADGIVKYTCYDQLRYLKTKDSVGFTNNTVGEIVKMIANDRRLNVGVIRDSNYKIPSLVKENGSMFDVIMQAIEMTTQETGEIFILYDRFGKLTLCPLEHMFRNVVINSSSITDFDYESTIDKQTYNSIILEYKSGTTGMTVRDPKKDEDSIAKWGLLELVEKTNNGWNSLKQKSDLLNHYNSKTKTLKIKGAMGAVEVVAGAVIVVSLDLGDMVVDMNMVVDAVTHRVEDGLYSMDLELIGGEFVSTRGVQGESKQGNDGTETPDSFAAKEKRETAAKDWGHGVTEEMLNKVLNGYLSGHGSYYLKCGNAFGVNPMLAALITKKECTEGGTINSYSARVRNNFGGITGDPDYPNMGKFAKYPSKEIGIERLFRLLGVVYIYQKGRKSISSIVYPWAPPKQNNTAQYIRELKEWYKKYTGVEWRDSLIGSGVSSFAEGKSRMYTVISNPNYNNSTSSGGAIPPHVEEARKHVGKSYSQMSKLGRMTSGLWCADFTAFCMKKAGNMPVPDTSSTRSMFSSFQSKGKAKHLDAARNYIPKSGDIIFFYNGSGRAGSLRIDHVGIVERVDGTKITTIEGNSGAKLNVARHTYYVGQSKITGYGIM
ncbi:XkdQ/YqbQ family protein [Peptostreptococcus faecalis]|uniref:XkdQ/YqbQ family protein n=1 Tax=Peptostreptococcus faecalis TaxID=2045015 RepID=UPI000C7B3060|nr:CHAP domain-containing protein [Peptostreptococcus faecalis]